MLQVTLDYVLEGERRGYAFMPQPEGLAPAVVSALWRQAMPRGQGWDDPVLADARSLKVFLLPDGQAALSEVTTTALRDEAGRGGIRRAAITVTNAAGLLALLSARLEAMPADVVAAAERRLMSRELALMFRKQRDLGKPRSLVKPQTILAYPYTTPAAWGFVEACLLLLATRATLLTNLIEVDPAINPFADRVVSFTTLTLEHHEEGRIVALPLARTRPDVPFIPLSD